MPGSSAQGSYALRLFKKSWRRHGFCISTSKDLLLGPEDYNNGCPKCSALECEQRITGNEMTPQVWVGLEPCRSGE